MNWIPRPKLPLPPKGPPKKGEFSEKKETTAGLFGEILDQMKPDAMTKDDNAELESSDTDLIETRGYELDDYRPTTAKPTASLERLVHLRSIHPLLGVYVADQLAMADPQERIAILESLLQVPGTVARFCRMPSLDDMPAGALATTQLDPQLLKLGLATAEELGEKSDEDEEEGHRSRFWPGHVRGAPCVATDHWGKGATNVPARIPTGA